MLDPGSHPAGRCCDNGWPIIFRPSYLPVVDEADFVTHPICQALNSAFLASANCLARPSFSLKKPLSFFQPTQSTVGSRWGISSNRRNRPHSLKSRDFVNAVCSNGPWLAATVPTPAAF